MKRSIFLLICALLVTGQAFSHEVVTRQVQSDVPFIIVYGRFVYPEHGVYTVTLADSTVVVNGVIYVPPEKPDIPSPEPDRKKAFLDWAVRYPALGARAIIEAGGTKEQAKKFIDDFYAQLADSTALRVEVHRDLYRIRYRGEEVVFVLPSQKREPKPDYWENVLRPFFDGLCYCLKKGDLVIKSQGAQMIFKEEIPEVAPQLRALPKTGRNPSASILHSTKGRKDIRIPSAVLEEILRENK
jgi:hypothetical protein